MAERDDLRQRKARYQVAAAELKEEKKRLAAGQYSRKGGNSSSRSDGSGINNNKPGGAARKQVKTTLTTVISSLDKLVDLEKRISTLENDSLYDRMGDPNTGAAEARWNEAIRQYCFACT